MTTHSHAIRKLRKLLTRKGYELADTNMLGADRYQLTECSDVTVWPDMREFHIAAAIRQVETDTRRKNPETSNETARAQTVWELAEVDRLEREAVDRALVKDIRLGGASKGLTESDVDALTKRAERILANRRSLDRLMRERPLGAGKR